MTHSLTSLFHYYDTATANLSPANQALVALAFLALLIWQVMQVVKSGHWIFIALLVIFLPGTWPAGKHIVSMLGDIVKFLIVRIQASL